jgi:hypothetical protein
MPTNSARAEADDAEDVVTDLELSDGCADCLDLTGQLRLGARRTPELSPVE